MTKKSIADALKDIQDRAYALCLKKNVITKDEYEDLTDRLYRKISNLKDEVDKGVEK